MYCVYGNSSWYINGGSLFGGGPLLGRSVIGGSTVYVTYGLQDLNCHLSTRIFLTGYKLSLADVLLYYGLHRYMVRPLDTTDSTVSMSIIYHNLSCDKYSNYNCVREPCYQGCVLFIFITDL